MKSSALCLSEIASPERLLVAWRHYRSGKRRRPAVAWFEIDAERRLLELSEAILAGTYRHGRYDLLLIHDPKARLIAVASVADRVVHRAAHDALAPCFNRSFVDTSFACLPGRGSHRAVLAYRQAMRRYRYVMHLDIASYFPSVDHQILLALLARRLRSRGVVALLGEILRSGAELYARPEVMRFYGLPPATGRGLPIGNLTSQWWGNLYLDGFDHFARRELGAPYLRYMDDMVFFADQPALLRKWRTEARDWLWHHRRLQLNPRKGHVRPCEQPQTYLGYRVRRTGFDLGPKALRRARRRIAKLRGGDPEKLRRSLASTRGAILF